VLGEEQLECVQLLGHTLDVVETIYTNDDFHAAKTLLKLSNSVDYSLL